MSFCTLLILPELTEFTLMPCSGGLGELFEYVAQLLAFMSMTDWGSSFLGTIHATFQNKCL